MLAFITQYIYIESVRERESVSIPKQGRRREKRVRKGKERKGQIQMA